jgi:hypothetical protein
MPRKPDYPQRRDGMPAKEAVAAMVRERAEALACGEEEAAWWGKFLAVGVRALGSFIVCAPAGAAIFGREIAR